MAEMNFPNAYIQGIKKLSAKCKRKKNEMKKKKARDVLYR